MYKNKNLIIKGHQNKSDGLWNIPLQPSPSPAACPLASSPALSKPAANTIFHHNKTHTELTQYYHATAGSPPLEAFFNDFTKGNFQTRPGINLICRKYLPEPKATIQGHLDQERKNLQSTQSQTPPLLPTPSLPLNPQTKTQECYTLIQPFNHQAYSDLTGKYPHKSSRGNQYILVVYDHDSNAILVNPLKNLTAAEITRVWLAIYTHL